MAQVQISLFPASLDEKIPSDSPDHLVNQGVNNLNISHILSGYKGGGTNAYHPDAQSGYFSYLNNLYSCRKIKTALTDRLSFMWFSGSQTPGRNTINTFRSKYLKDSITEGAQRIMKEKPKMQTHLL